MPACNESASHGVSSRQKFNGRWKRGRSSAGQDALIGSSPALQEVRDHVARVAGRRCTVLIVGESGVGKELVALALHQQSARRDGPMVTVNCAAIAASMTEGELFGSLRGAYTGAERDRKGYFQQADSVYLWHCV